MPALKMWAACADKGLLNVRANGPVVLRNNVRKVQKHGPYIKPAPVVALPAQQIVSEPLFSKPYSRKLIFTRGG